jgi:hypothetical protein
MSSNGISKGSAQGASLLELAENILQKTKDITKYYQANNLAAPTFSLQSAAPPPDPAYEALQSGLKGTLEDLQRLVDGPRGYLRSFAAQTYDLAAMQIALDFDFFTLVPSQGDVALADLAQKAGLDVDRVSRVVRMLITQRVFVENKPDYISHSSTSLVLHQDQEMRATVHYTYEPHGCHRKLRY